MPSGFAIYTSHRLEDLLEVLAARIAHEPLPPLVEETILVPGQGIARWLRLQLADRHGIAAGLAMPFPGAFLRALVHAAEPDRTDVFEPDVLAWRIHRLLPTPSLREDLGLAARYCDEDPDGRRRFQLSQRLADCLDDYQLYRPELLGLIADGGELAGPGPHARWQAALWRALLRDADEGASAAHRLKRVGCLLADDVRARAALPPRLSMFGAATLPPALLDLLRRIADVVPVTLYVPTPSPTFFGDLRRRAAPGEAAQGNALLARLGTEAREFQSLLVDLQDSPAGAAITWHDVAPRPADEGTTDQRGGERAPTDLLGCLQEDLAWVREHGAGPELPRFVIPEGDASLRVHDCHSEQRELEIVRDQILAAFAEDRTLQPHEVMVLVPDIERYAPIAHAVFGPVQVHLPFQVADKSPLAEQPACMAVFRVLQLAQGRLPQHDVLHLLETPAVRRRFGLFEADLPVLQGFCERAGIRWGLDGASRSAHCGVPEFEDNSWREGIARMLLGVATGPTDELVLDHLPTADVTSSREPLLERFLTFLEQLFAAIEPLRRPRPLHRWADRIDALVAELLQPALVDERGLAALRDAATTLRDLAERSRHRESVAPIVLQDWLQRTMARAGESHGFFGGRVTVAAMLPMRAVPVRHLFLCGLGFDSFPRRDRNDPFDLVVAARRPGDRSARLDDRQLFLDCLLAARQRLHITFVGRSQSDDSECAPSVVLAELLETIDRTCEPGGAFERARDQVVVRHPLQPWSPRYRDGADPRLFTFAATASAPPTIGTEEEPAFCRGPLTPIDPPATEPIELETLIGFWANPCRFFLRRGVGIRLPRDGDAPRPTEPFGLDHLERFRLLDEGLRDAFEGTPATASWPPEELAQALASGRLPSGGAGISTFAELHEQQQQVLDEVRRRGPFATRTIIAHGDDFTIAGTLEGISPNALVSVFAGKASPRRRLEAWIRHVVAAAARLEGSPLPGDSIVVCRDATMAFAPLDREVALTALAAFVEGMREGVHAALPFFERASHAFAAALAKNPTDLTTATTRARTGWEGTGSRGSRSDRDDPHAALCMRGRDPVHEDQFARWAERIWTPVLEHEGKAP